MPGHISADQVVGEKMRAIQTDLNDDKKGSLAKSPLAHGMAIYMFRHLHEMGSDLEKEHYWNNFQQQFTGFPDLYEEFEKAWGYLESRLL